MTHYKIGLSQPNEGVGQRIADAANKMHMSPQGLAIAVGITLREVVSIEVGDTIPSDEILFRIGEVLGSPFHWLKYADEHCRPVA
ncbi:MAG: helix-turn-helix transcriptional regulator [Bacteroidota bacterium]